MFTRPARYTNAIREECCHPHPNCPKQFSYVLFWPALLISLLPIRQIYGQTEKPEPDIKPPRLIYKSDPEYSAKGKSAGIEGTVVVKLIVGADGHPTNIEVVRPLGYGLDEKAVETVEKWTFEPATKDGLPVRFSATIEVNFRLAPSIYTKEVRIPADVGIDLSSIHMPSGPSIRVRNGEGTLIAPGMNKHRYDVNAIDLRRFVNGGTLVIHVSVGQGRISGSFDLFGSQSVLDFRGDPTRYGSLAHAYNIPGGSEADLIYEFQTAPVLTLGAEGSWLSWAGTTGHYKFTARVFEPLRSIIKESYTLPLSAANDLERRLELDPEDLDTRIELLAIYASRTARGEIELVRDLRARHILWTIEHYPAAEVLSTRICAFNTVGEPLADEAMYIKGKNLWMEQVRRFPGNLTVLRNAAYYFKVSDKEEAEKLIMTMISKDSNPDSVRLLGELYGLAILGVDTLDYKAGAGLHSEESQAHSNFAMRALATVEASSNVDLVGSATQTAVEQNDAISALGQMSWDSRPVCERLLMKARRLDPQNISYFLLSLPSPHAGRIRVNAQELHTRKRVKAVYPSEAKGRGIRGVVRVFVVVDREGNVTNLEPSSGPRELIQSACDAVRQWKYDPPLVEGTPTEVVTTVEVKF